MLKQQIKMFCSDLSYEVDFHAVDTTQRLVVYEDRSLIIETLPLEHRVECCGYLFREKATLPHIRRSVADFYQVPVSQFANIKAGADWITPDGTTIGHAELTEPSMPPRCYAYCSDTRYMPQLAAMLSGVTTLYHESTYADVDRQKAEKYWHSTALQAATVARDAGVKQLLLGHYSSRYDDERVLLNEAQSVFENAHLTDEMQIFDV